MECAQVLVHTARVGRPSSVSPNRPTPIGWPDLRQKTERARPALLAQLAVSCPVIAGANGNAQGVARIGSWLSELAPTKITITPPKEKVDVKSSPCPC